MLLYFAMASKGGDELIMVTATVICVGYNSNRAIVARQLSAGSGTSFQ